MQKSMASGEAINVADWFNRRRLAQDWDPGYMVINGGRPLSGFAPRVTQGFPLWRAALSQRFHVGDDLERYRALRARMRGGARAILVSPQWGQCRYGYGQRLGLRGGIPHGDTTLFSDGAGYAERPVFAALAAVPAFGNVVRVASTAFRPGDYIRFAGRLRQVDHVVPASPGVVDLEFSPFLLRAAPSGLPVSTSAWSAMVLESADSGRIPEALSRKADIQLVLVERPEPEAF